MMVQLDTLGTILIVHEYMYALIQSKVSHVGQTGGHQVSHSFPQIPRASSASLESQRCLRLPWMCCRFTARRQAQTMQERALSFEFQPQRRNRSLHVCLLGLASFAFVEWKSHCEPAGHIFWGVQSRDKRVQKKTWITKENTSDLKLASTCI